MPSRKPLISGNWKMNHNHYEAIQTVQKLAYLAVVFVLLPVMVLTGLTMSPAVTAAMPFLFDLFDELGYAGWIGCEYKSAAAPRDTLEGLKPYLRRAAR